MGNDGETHTPPASPPGTGCESIGGDMTAWLSVLVPLLVMFFALGMERVESRLRQSTVSRDELGEIVEQPRPDEVRVPPRRAVGRALDLFRLRSGGLRGRRTQRRSKALPS